MIISLRRVPTNTAVFFVWFLTMQEKQILGRPIGIQKKIGGNHAFFRKKLSNNISKER